MRKMRLSVLSILLCLCCLVGCGSQSDNAAEDTQADTESTTVEEEKDPFEGFEESTSPERFGEDVSFELTGDVAWEEPSRFYGNMNEDGSIDLILDVTDGTPYDIEGPIYDHDMFTLKKFVKHVRDDSGAVGGGSVTCLYRFIPIKSGNTEIVTVYTYLTDDVYVGTIYSITVTDDLQCKIDQIGGVTQGENIEVREPSDSVS